MQAATHVLSGMLIQLFCFIYFPFPYNIIFTIVFAFLSHFVVDMFAKITYHTPEPQKGDKFWAAWGIIMVLVGISLLVWIIAIGLFFFFLLGGIFANLVDIIDWFIIRPIQNKRKNNKGDARFFEKGFFHAIIDKLREKTLFWLPDWNYERKGVVPEIIIVIILWISVILLIPKVIS